MLAALNPRRALVFAFPVALAATPFLLPAVPAEAATAKAGATCTRVGAKSGTLTCTRRSGRLVWVRASTAITAAPTTAVVGSSTTAAGSATTAAGAATATGIEGTWKPTPASTVGYRVKEILLGQDTEGVGRTNAVTGSLVIAGTRAQSAEFVVDMTTLSSDNGNRDRQVRGRILDTATHPTSTLKLLSPIDFGKVPADKETIKAKAKVELTLRGTKKAIDIDVEARRNGATIEILGSIPINFPEWNIPNPSAGPATVGDNGILEFLVVLGR